MSFAVLECPGGRLRTHRDDKGVADEIIVNAAGAIDKLFRPGFALDNLPSLAETERESQSVPGLGLYRQVFLLDVVTLPHIDIELAHGASAVLNQIPVTARQKGAWSLPSMRQPHSCLNTPRSGKARLRRSQWHFL